MGLFYEHMSIAEAVGGLIVLVWSLSMVYWYLIIDLQTSTRPSVDQCLDHPHSRSSRIVGSTLQTHVSYIGQAPVAGLHPSNPWGSSDHHTCFLFLDTLFTRFLCGSLACRPLFLRAAR